MWGSNICSKYKPLIKTYNSNEEEEEEGEEQDDDEEEVEEVIGRKIGSMS